jgi:superfamily II DNA or RNA helicase
MNTMIKNNSYIGKKGYTIPKKLLNDDELYKLKKELTVRPFAPPTSIQKPSEFMIFRESPKKIYVPRFYGIEKYGIPSKINIEEGEDIDIKFNGTLRDYQENIVKTFVKQAKETGGGLIDVPCGYGKCLAYNTPILMYNGKIKMVQNIKIGDKIMGDDSKERNVFIINNGIENMYKITNKHNESYIVNESHILSLFCVEHIIYKQLEYNKGDILDINILEYLNTPKLKKYFKGYKTPVRFKNIRLNNDIYVDHIIDNINTITYNKFNINYDNDNNFIKYYRINEIINNTFYREAVLLCTYIDNFDPKLKKEYKKYYNLKNINNNIKLSNVVNQLSFIFGIIDFIGIYKDEYYEIYFKQKSILNDLLFMVSSIGIDCFIKEDNENNSFLYIYNSIFDYQISFRNNNLVSVYDYDYYIKHNLITDLKIEYNGYDKYYGFMIDGNHRFLLGDFTVTHNTVMGLNIITQLKKKTLIIVHKEFLMNQWIERIEQYLPDAKVGKIQGKIIDTENKDIVLGMLQSLSMKDYNDNLFSEFGFTLIDECFPYDTEIHTNDGLFYIGALYEMWKNNMKLPKILSYNKLHNKLEYKELTYSWENKKQKIIQINFKKGNIKCTPNHKILTNKGYIEASMLNKNDLILCNNYNKSYIKPYLTEDLKQLIYGSFLGNSIIHRTEDNSYCINFSKLENIIFGKTDHIQLWKEQLFNIQYKNNNSYEFHLDDNIFVVFNNEVEKIITDEFINNIDLRGIYVWFIDKSFVNNEQKYIIDISNFDKNEYNQLIKILNKQNLNPTIENINSIDYLVFNIIDSYTINRFLKPYIINNSSYDWDNNIVLGSILVDNIKNINQEVMVYDIEVKHNHNFVVGLNKQDGVIVHNCHHIGAEVFSRSLFKIVSKYMMGLSATMNRKDGLTFVFKKFLGDIAYKLERDSSDEHVLVKTIKYYNDDDEFSKVEYNYKGQVHYSIMISKICQFNPRSEFIIKVLQKELSINSNQQIMILAHNKCLLKYLHDAIQHRNIATVGYYVGGMKEKALKETENKQVVIATYAMAEEALDIKTLSALILATPRSDVTQAVGRILRMKHENPVVYDIIDQHDFFNTQYFKRQRFYKKCKYKILQTDSDSFIENTEDDIWKVIYDPIKNNKIKETKVNKQPILNGMCLLNL